MTSHDGLATCPICYKKIKQALEQREREILKQYGIIDKSKFVQLVSQFVHPSTITRKTLKEVYTIGVDEEKGEFFVRYSALCSECGFNHDFVDRNLINTRRLSWTAL